MSMIIRGHGLTVEDVVKVARFGESVEIDDLSRKNLETSRKRLEKLIEEGSVIYGINTGLGDLVRVRIDAEDVKKLQLNLVRSHSAGTGDAMPEEIVRGAMLIRANSLLKGFSGVRPVVVDKLIEFLNRGITPLVPKFGSVGASGDLAPLAHIALAMIGEGKVIFEGKIMGSAEAMEIAGIEPIELESKEGLALLNGTSVMASYAAIAVYDAYDTLLHALISSSMAFEALRGTDRALDPRIMEVRPHPGQAKIAEILRYFLDDSDIVKMARMEKVQDAYTLRCVPQVYGAVLDALRYVKAVVEREINSATDNPLVFDEVISGGNFHGEPIALAMDFLAIALTDLGNMIERRIARLVDGHLSGLPHFLVEKSGINSGFMIPQYTAAALCNRNKILSYPASVDSIPTSANQEDHVSMGMNSAIKLREIVDNLRNIVAIEFLCANQALHLSRSSASTVKEAMEAIGIPKIDEDVIFSDLISKIRDLMDDGEILRHVKKASKITL